MSAPRIETIERWRSPASEYPRSQVGSAQIADSWYSPGMYAAYQTQAADYYEATKRLRITVLKIDGKTWMVDDPPHWWAMLDHAEALAGHVLCAGLGLGLMVHAMQANSRIEKVTVVERSQDVIDLVGPRVPQDKLTIIHADWYEQDADTIPAVDGVLFDLFVGAGRELLGSGFDAAAEICRRWDFPTVRVHGLPNPLVGVVGATTARAGDIWTAQGP